MVPWRVRQLIFLISLTLGAQVDLFDYRAPRPLDIKIVSSEFRGAIEIRDITYASFTGDRTKAFLVIPSDAGKLAAGLFVHWYDTESPTSNRTQYLEEAVEMARHGMVGLLPETMWERTDWFNKRDPQRDFEASVNQVKELRRALDVLIVQPRVSASKIAYIGHDFGAMYGVLVASADPRVKVLALQAGTTSFSDWFLLGRKLEALQKIEVMQKLAPLDPLAFIGSVKAPVLFQFASKDPYVPAEKAQAFFDAAKNPKKLFWYQAGHALNDQAVRDRREWLVETLSLP